MKKTVLVIFSSFFLLLIGFWFIVLPEQSIINLIENSLHSENLYLKTEGFRKGFFYSFRTERIVLMKRGHFRKKEPVGSETPLPETPVVIFDDFRGRINLLSLLKLSPRLDFECTVNGGTVKGEIGLAGKGTTRIQGAGISLQGIPLLELIGIHGNGDLSVTFSLGSGTGEMKFSIDNARLKATSFEGAFIPLDLFHTGKGVLTMNAGTVRAKSLALYGSGVYARITGSMSDDNLNMNLELMIDSTFSLGAAFQSLLERYKVSPGYYVIPLKTTIVL